MVEDCEVSAMAAVRRENADSAPAENCQVDRATRQKCQRVRQRCRVTLEVGLQWFEGKGAVPLKTSHMLQN
jgi:malate synthase